MKFLFQNKYRRNNKWDSTNPISLSKLYGDWGFAVYTEQFQAKLPNERNLNWTLPLLTTTAMKSLPLDRDDSTSVCPCHSSSPSGWSVMTAISIVSSLCSLCVKRDRGSSMKPPDDENSADVDSGCMSTASHNNTLLSSSSSSSLGTCY